MNVFFMYFEARNNPWTAPLAIYLAGGPGEASSYAAMNSENGPCVVKHEGTSTTMNPWSFNNYVNMLYIDQPIQVGFSYSSLANGTYNSAFLVVTEQCHRDSSTRPGGILRPVYVIYRELKSYGTSSKEINCWGNSYGGLPFAQEKGLRVDAIEITNGCVDFYYQIGGYPEYTNINTYGIKFYNDTFYQEIRNNITKPNGYLDLTEQYRQAGQVGDPNYIGNNATVNQICTEATLYCATIITPLYRIHNVSTYDIAMQKTPGTSAYYLTMGEYLNSPDVQSALGVPLNWTWYCIGAANAFAGTGDSFRQSNMPNLEYLLNDRVKTALIYGDRDDTCPKTGAETLARAVSWEGRKGFADAGYQELGGLSASATGGAAIQYGQLSFTRVFETGHQVSAYSPETVFTIFNRTIFKRDVVSGKVTVKFDYRTQGPKESSSWKSQLLGPFVNVCMVSGNFSSSTSFAAPNY
ncbi:alpha/beta-hydrolase [Thozetella sp. PMI_491]|nr:alpha/beta-hydrolase [Thozetella sp. PMI_491]